MREAVSYFVTVFGGANDVDGVIAQTWYAVL